MAKERGTGPGGTGQGPVGRKEPEHPTPCQPVASQALAGPVSWRAQLRGHRIRERQNQGQCLPTPPHPSEEEPGGERCWRTLGLLRHLSPTPFPRRQGARSKTPKKELK